MEEKSYIFDEEKRIAMAIKNDLIIIEQCKKRIERNKKLLSKHVAEEIMEKKNG